MSFSGHTPPAAISPGFKTADLCDWRLEATDQEGKALIGKFAALTGMDLSSKQSAAESQSGCVKRIIVRVRATEPRWRKIPLARAGRIECWVGPTTNHLRTAIQLLRISRIIAHHCELGGGLLLHGALVARGEEGVILAGPGGVGKTTASRRLPPPWHALSDDAALVVKSPDGNYWVHPWPTWSRVRAGIAGEAWDLAAEKKLAGIFMLAQAANDRVLPLPSRQAVSELVDVSGQTHFIMANGLGKAAIRCINLLRFANAEKIAKKIPICRLEISRQGLFWNEIDSFLVKDLRGS